MVDGVEELPYVALERVAGTRVVTTYGTNHFGNLLYSLVCTFTNTARERCRNKSWLKDWIENAKNRVVKHAVAHSRLVDSPEFWVVNPETLVSSVSIDTVLEVAI